MIVPGCQFCFWRQQQQRWSRSGSSLEFCSQPLHLLCVQGQCLSLNSLVSFTSSSWSIVATDADATTAVAYSPRRVSVHTSLHIHTLSLTAPTHSTTTQQVSCVLHASGLPGARNRQRSRQKRPQHSAEEPVGCDAGSAGVVGSGLCLRVRQVSCGRDRVSFELAVGCGIIGWCCVVAAGGEHRQGHSVSCESCHGCEQLSARHVRKGARNSQLAVLY